MTGGMFVQHHRDQKLQQHASCLECMAELADFVRVAAAVDAAYQMPERSKGGRSPYPSEAVVRVLFLQAVYNLSGEQTEHHLLDRRSFQLFCGRADELRIPDARTIWLFQQRLTQGGMDAPAIFDALQQQVRARGHSPRGGQFVGPTIVRAPVQHPSKEEKAQVRQDVMPADWIAKEFAHKDTESCSTKMHEHSDYGYKLHPAADACWKLMRRWKATAANVENGNMLPGVIDRTITAARLLADRGYDHEANRQVLAERGREDGIARKAKAGKKLGQRALARNMAISRTRSRIEHVFV